MKYLIFLSILFVSNMILNSCTEAGEGGKAIINVHVIVNEYQAPYAEVKIKYNATGFPGAGAGYNDIDTCDYAGKTSFRKLRRGNYYVYVTYQSDTSTTIMEGGATVKISNRIGEQHVVVDLSEADPF